jgi:hypothetical protein
LRRTAPRRRSVFRRRRRGVCCRRWLVADAALAVRSSRRREWKCSAKPFNDRLVEPSFFARRSSLFLIPHSVSVPLQPHPSLPRPLQARSHLVTSLWPFFVATRHLLSSLMFSANPCPALRLMITLRNVCLVLSHREEGKGAFVFSRGA